MRFSNYIMIFLIIFACITIPIFYKTNISTKSAQINTDYANYLITATKSGLDAAAGGKTDGTYIFQTTESRQKAVDAFYDTLVKCFNYERSTSVDLVKYYVPCVFLIDTDGFYVEYTEEYVNGEGIHCYNEVTTPINKWARTYSYGSGSLLGTEFYVEYHLDNTISVSYKNPSGVAANYTGTYPEVLKKLISESTESLSAMTSVDSTASLEEILSNPTSFEEEKREIIISEIQDQLEYYINTQDETYNRVHNVQYEFTIPQVTGEDWARLVDNSTILSFLQGMQTEYDNSFLNIYSLAGSEVEEDFSYYIKEVGGVNYYHRNFCTELTADDLKSKNYSMEQAAKRGAFPCPECIH